MRKTSALQGAFFLPQKQAAHIYRYGCAYLPLYTNLLVTLRIFTVTEESAAHIYRYGCAYLPLRLRIFTVTAAHIYR